MTYSRKHSFTMLPPQPITLWHAWLLGETLCPLIIIQCMGIMSLIWLLCIHYILRPWHNFLKLRLSGKFLVNFFGVSLRYVTMCAYILCTSTCTYNPISVNVCRFPISWWSIKFFSTSCRSYHWRYIQFIQVITTTGVLGGISDTCMYYYCSNCSLGNYYCNQIQQEERWQE